MYLKLLIVTIKVRKEIREFAADINILLAGDDTFLDKLEASLSGQFGRIDKQTDLHRYIEETANYDFSIAVISIDSDPGRAIDLADKMKDNNGNTAVIFLSENTDSEHLLKALNTGVDAFLTKPVKPDELQKALSRVLNSLLSTQKFERYKSELEEQLDVKARQLLFRNKWFKYQLSIDSLTGLFNRIKLIEVLEKKHKNGLLLVNIDNFSHLNLGYGFHFGDQILKAVAGFIENIMPPESLSFRLQSDEFAILIENPDHDDSESLARRVISELPRLNMNVMDIGVKVGCSVGYAIGTGDDLIRKAHIALLDARSRGRGRQQGYHESLDIELIQRENIHWINELKDAIEKDRLVPFYQPIFDNQSKKPVKYECLIRMFDTRGEMISPGKFLGPAKMAGLLPLITGAVVEKAFDYLKEPDMHLSINISDQDIKGRFLVDYLLRKVNELKIDPGQITLEILEDIEPGMTDEWTRQVKDLKTAGFKIALDDFGVSCSNFSRLNDYKPDYIKIDGLFIKGIAENKEKQNITHVILQVAQSINAEVVAEFVAEKEDFEYVRDIGIHYSQGFYLGKPAEKPG